MWTLFACEFIYVKTYAICHFVTILINLAFKENQSFPVIAIFPQICLPQDYIQSVLPHM